AKNLNLPDPHRRVMEHRAAVGPAGVRRRDGVDADAGLEVAVRPDALDDHDAALMPLLRPGMNDRLAALVADTDAIALGDAHGRTVLGVHHRRRPYFPL